MKLFFKSAQSKLATVDVDPNMTVLQFKKQVAELEGIPVHLQRLMYLGKQLTDSMTLADYKVTKDSTIQVLLSQKAGKPMDINIQMLDGQTLTLECEQTYLISDLKIKIATMSHITEDQMRLIFAGKQLEDGRTLQDYNI